MEIFQNATNINSYRQVIILSTKPPVNTEREYTMYFEDIVIEINKKFNLVHPDVSTLAISYSSDKIDDFLFVGVPIGEIGNVGNENISTIDILEALNYSFFIDHLNLIVNKNTFYDILILSLFIYCKLTNTPFDIRNNNTYYLDECTGYNDRDDNDWIIGQVIGIKMPKIMRSKTFKPFDFDKEEFEYFKNIFYISKL